MILEIQFVCLLTGMVQVKDTVWLSGEKSGKGDELARHVDERDWGEVVQGEKSLTAAAAAAAAADTPERRPSPCCFSVNPHTR
jgi:hypothetical protein